MLKILDNLKKKMLLGNNLSHHFWSVFFLWNKTYGKRAKKIMNDSFVKCQ